jgi:short-subunit dehydrogenase
MRLEKLYRKRYKTMSRTWLITGVSSGFGYEMTKPLLEKGDSVVGTVRNTKKVEELIKQYPDKFDCKILDVTDVSAVHKTVDEAFAKHEKIDVIVSNAGYGLFGAAEELTDEEVNHIIATNLTGSIALIRSSLPYLRKQESGNIIQIFSYGGQVAYAANSMYHATKFGIEGFCESVAQEVAKFNIKVTIVEPGGARTEFCYGSAKVANLTPEYDHVHGFLNMLDASKGLAPGDPAKMAERIIESVDKEDTPLHMVLGSQALAATIGRLEERVATYKTQTELAASTDITE